jgi:hypothetical protein
MEETCLPSASPISEMPWPAFHRRHNSERDASENRIRRTDAIEHLPNQLNQKVLQRPVETADAFFSLRAE